jgi:uncharacterized membrane protein
MSRVSKGLWGLAALLSAGIAVFSYRFLLPHPMMGEEIAQNLMRRPWLAIHATLAATALLVGPFQFLPGLRARAPKVHRWIGKVYVIACLCAAPAGLALALGSSAGPIAQSGFGVLSIIWFCVTAHAFRLAVTGRIAEHRRWMIRSFAMTFAAVNLRLYLPFPPMMGFSFIEGYRAISWLAWVPNLMVAELYLNRARWFRPSRRPNAALT